MPNRNTKLKSRIGNQSEKMSRPKPDPMHQYDYSPRIGGYGPSVEQFHRDAQIGLARSASERTRSQDDHNHSRKTTVLSRVKEKAKRWKTSFLKKRDSHGDNSSISVTPPWHAQLKDEDNDNDEDYQDENPEYLGAPMYESELAPEEYREHARQHPRAFPVISEKHVLPSNTGHVPESIETKHQTTASETEKHATHETRKIIKTDNDNDDNDDYQETEKHLISDNEPPSSTRENKWDKGVSVKEYIMNKLEPGEDEKVLSKVISDAMAAPIRNHGDRVGVGVGVMEKMKVAVNSLLGREEPKQTTMTRLNVSMSNESQSVTEEESHGRILQTN